MSKKTSIRVSEQSARRIDQIAREASVIAKRRVPTNEIVDALVNDLDYSGTTPWLERFRPH